MLSQLEHFAFSYTLSQVIDDNVIVELFLQALLQREPPALTELHGTSKMKSNDCLLLRDLGFVQKLHKKNYTITM